MKKDNETDADIQSNNSYLVLLKRFKRFKNNDDSKYIKSCEQNINCVSFDIMFYKYKNIDTP